MTVHEKIAQLEGVAQPGGINWCWADFPTHEAALEFDVWCEANNLETRGVYPPNKADERWSVRYR